MDAMRRLLLCLLALLMSALPASAAQPSTPVSLTLSVQRKGSAVLLTMVLRNDRAAPICVRPSALAPREIELWRGKRSVGLKRQYDWEGRPPPECQLIPAGGLISSNLDIGPRYRLRPRVGDQVCYGEVWAEVGPGPAWATPSAVLVRRCVRIR